MIRLFFGALALLLCGCQAEGQGNETARQPLPTLHVITGLPLFFSEGFSLEGGEHPLIGALEREYRVVPVDGPEELPAEGLLLAAQPRAMIATRLVALDRWVRDGGRLVLLADPRLDWESELPLGDPERPPYQYADTGLLAHWGLVLDGPEETGPKSGTLSGREVATSSPGMLTATKSACKIRDAGLVAQCRLGRGEATVIADADLLHVDGQSAIDGPTQGNISAILAELQLISPR